MKVSELKLACELFLLHHPDTEVKMIWEQGVFDEGYDPECLEEVTDARAVPDWPLPGQSLVFSNEEASMMFVMLYGNEEPYAVRK